MAPRTVGIIHPGQMGISIAAAAQTSGHAVYWASAGRSAQSQARAAEHDLRDAGPLAELCATCEALISVCPPHAAENLAAEVAGHAFAGLYLDANAIAPDRARRIGQTVSDAGARFVDGGIIGGPAWEPGKTFLHLSGPDAAEAAELFTDSPLVTNILGPDPDKASALKMCFAANTKGTMALLCAIVATAEELGVREALFKQWSGSNFDEKATDQVRGVTSKAWRFIGEMHEISSTFEAAGLPGGFHAAAADIYERIASFKDAPETPSLDEILVALNQKAEA